MDPHAFNQLVIDQAMVVHNHCMDHCLDKDSEAYRFWSSQREHSLALCKHAALAAREQQAFVQRYYVPCPGRVRIANFRAQRAEAARHERDDDIIYDDDIPF